MGGEALADLIAGEAVPSGKLPMAGRKDNGGSGQPTPRSILESRLAEAKANGNQVEQIKIKQEAAQQGISLL